MPTPAYGILPTLSMVPLSILTFAYCIPKTLSGAPSFMPVSDKSISHLGYNLIYGTLTYILIQPYLLFLKFLLV